VQAHFSLGPMEVEKGEAKSKVGFGVSGYAHESVVFMHFPNQG